MKIYIAASLTALEDARSVRRLLEAEGHVVTSRWLDYPPKDHAAVPPLAARRHAEEDLADVDHADCLLFLNDMDRPSTGGGMWVEYGYALGHNKMICMLGDYTSIFQHLPSVVWIKSVVVLLRYLKATESIAYSVQGIFR